MACARAAHQPAGFLACPPRVQDSPPQPHPRPQFESTSSRFLDNITSSHSQAALGGFAVAAAYAVSRRRPRTTVKAFRDDATSRANPQVQALEKPFKEATAPGNLYQLFGVPTSADAGTIKKAYYDKQKVCHPDVAGKEGEEMSVLLNDAYRVLTDHGMRSAYDQQLALTTTEEKKPAVATDLNPTWKWTPKQHGVKPTWTGDWRTEAQRTLRQGMPRSRSKWDKVDPEERGERHAKHQFVYVDEWSCISCRNCCDVSPHTFCIDAESGRARVYTQWGNNEEYLDYAVQSCPVDCIYWVGREELQSLEHVTAEKMYNNKGGLPCSMAILNGLYTNHVDDPFEGAREFRRKLKEERERKEKSGAATLSPDKFEDRIRMAFERLSNALKMAGWG